MSSIKFLIALFTGLIALSASSKDDANNTNIIMNMAVEKIPGRPQFKQLVIFDPSTKSGNLIQVPVSRISMKRAGGGHDYSGPMDILLYDSPFLAVVDSKENKVRIFHERFGDRDFFYYDGNQFLHFMFASQEFIVRTNYLFVGSTTNDLNSCITQLSQLIGRRNLTGKYIIDTDRRVEMRPAVPDYFFPTFRAPEEWAH